MSGRIIKLLVDSGASKNYIRPLEGVEKVSVNNTFKVNSIHGSNIIESKCFLNIFGGHHCFFILPQLETFDGIIGLDLLLAVNAVINLKEAYIATTAGREYLKYFECKDVNIIIPDNLQDNQESLLQVLTQNEAVFADPEESLPFNTNVIASIRTTDNEPIFSRFYPYPVGVSEFVNNEIQNLLDNGIIRRSRSPYNSPIWIVDKKGFDDDGNRKKRMVIDFRKLNERTVDDKYPVPDINIILSNLGRGKFFSKVDLKSGFHQILLKESDREKTAFSVNNGKYEFCRLPFWIEKCAMHFSKSFG